MVFFVSGFVLVGVITTKFLVSKSLQKTLERCMPPDHQKSESEADSSDEETCDHGQDVAELAAQAVDDYEDEDEEQQPMVGATNRTVGILRGILRWVLNTGIDVARTASGETREPTLTEGRLLSGSESSTGCNSLDSPSDSGDDGGDDVL